jgi:hypothetical protein
MKKNHVPSPRAIAATIQPIQTKARAARSLLRSEGIPIPDCLAGERLSPTAGVNCAIRPDFLAKSTPGWNRRPVSYPVPHSSEGST